MVERKLTSFREELEDYFLKGISELKTERDDVGFQHLFVLADYSLDPNRLSENSKLKVKNRYRRFLIYECNQFSKNEIGKMIEENWLHYRLVYTRYNQQISYTDELWARVQPFLMKQLFYFDVEKILTKSKNQIFKKVHSDKSEKFRYYMNNKEKEEKWKSRGKIISNNISLDYKNKQDYLEYYKRFSNAKYKINECLDRKKLLVNCGEGEIFLHEENLKVTGLGAALFGDFFKEIGYIQFIKPDKRIKSAISKDGIIAKNNLLNELKKDCNFTFPKSKEWTTFIIIDYLTYKLLQLHYEKKSKYFLHIMLLIN